MLFLNPFRERFFLSKDNSPFSPSPPPMIVFTVVLSVYSSPRSVTTRSDCCCCWHFNPKPSYFHHPTGGGVTADDKEATLNENAGADAVSFTSAILGGGYITDEEGAAPKEKFLTAIAAVTEAISAGVISSNGPMEKSAAGTEEAFS